MKVNPAKPIYNNILGVIYTHIHVKFVWSDVLYDIFNVVLVLVNFIIHSVDRGNKVCFS